MTLAEKLREINKTMSQAEIAAELDRTQPCVNNWLQGIRLNIGFNDGKKIEQIFDRIQKASHE